MKKIVSISPYEAKYMLWLFCLRSNTNGWNGHMPSTIQHKWLKLSRDKHNRDRHNIMLRFRFVALLSLYFMRCRQKATKNLPALKLDVTVSYVGHAFQTFHVFSTCYVITSNNCVHLVTK